MKKTILAAAVLLSTSPAYSGEPYLVAGLGRSQAMIDSRAGTPAWQQRGFPHHEDILSSSYDLGLGYDFTHSLSAELRYYQNGNLTKSTGQWGHWRYCPRIRSCRSAVRDSARDIAG